MYRNTITNETVERLPSVWLYEDRLITGLNESTMTRYGWIREAKPTPVMSLDYLNRIKEDVYKDALLITGSKLVAEPGKAYRWTLSNVDNQLDCIPLPVGEYAEASIILTVNPGGALEVTPRVELNASIMSGETAVYKMYFREGRGEFVRLSQLEGAPASYTVNVTPTSYVHTIDNLQVTKPILIDWGDGEVQSISSTGRVTHAYPTPDEDGESYTVLLRRPEHILSIRIIDPLVTIDSNDLAPMRNVSSFNFNGVKGRFDFYDVRDWRPRSITIISSPNLNITCNSTDLKKWRPLHFYMSNCSNTNGVFTTEDLKDWRPNQLILSFLPSKFSLTIRTVDLKDWRPNDFRLLSLPHAIGPINSIDMAYWPLHTLYLGSCPLLTGEINSIDFKDPINSVPRFDEVFYLYSLPRTRGTINTVDMQTWRPNIFVLTGLPSVPAPSSPDYEVVGYTGTVDSQHFKNYDVKHTFAITSNPLSGTFNTSDFGTDFRPASFSMTNLPNVTGSVNTANMVDWPLNSFNINTFPEGLVPTVNTEHMANWPLSSMLYIANMTNLKGKIASADLRTKRPSNYMYLFNLNHRVDVLEDDCVITLDTYDMAPTPAQVDSGATWRISSFAWYQMRHATIKFNSAHLKWLRPNYFYMYFTATSGYSPVTPDEETPTTALDSAHFSAWRPSDFYLLGNPYGVDNITGTFDFEDLKAWRNLYVVYVQHFDDDNIVFTLNSSSIKDWNMSGPFYLKDLTNASGTMANADFASWNSSGFLVSNVPGLTWNITYGGFGQKPRIGLFYFNDNGLSAEQVDMVIREAYRISLHRRSSSGAVLVKYSGFTVGGNTPIQGTFGPPSAQGITEIINDPTSPNKTNAAVIAYELRENTLANPALSTWKTVTVTTA